MSDYSGSDSEEEEKTLIGHLDDCVLKARDADYAHDMLIEKLNLLPPNMSDAYQTLRPQIMEASRSLGKAIRQLQHSLDKAATEASKDKFLKRKHVEKTY